VKHGFESVAIIASVAFFQFLAGLVVYSPGIGPRLSANLLSVFVGAAATEAFRIASRRR
jgi:hypothetical protein